VYYRLSRDNLSGTLVDIPDPFIVPASEIIHDRMVCLFHPLVGMSPIYACAAAAAQGSAMQTSSGMFFTNGARPSGVLIGPAGMTDVDLAKVRANWQQSYGGPSNAGTVAAIAGDLKYNQLTTNPVDAELIAQLKWTAENICSVFHVPAWMIGAAEIPRGVQLDAMTQLYYSQAIQSLTTNFETVLDDGLGLDGTDYGTEFDITDLIWLDLATKTKAAADAIGSGAMAPNEARKRYFDLGPVAGGDSVYMQQQMFSLEALAQRDAADPFAKPEPAPMAAPALPPGQLSLVPPVTKDITPDEDEDEGHETFECTLREGFA
jgi:HK97 family phage portal protein